MKGIVLAGGSGTRLHPLTIATSKQLLPIYDKPMVYYPISVLMLAGIREILIISTPHDINSYKKLLGDGKNFGVKFSYKVQENPNGLVEAFILGESFINGESVCLVLGDNIFYGQNFSSNLKNAVSNEDRATVFGYKVKDPERFGVVDFDSNGKALSIEEKPMNPKSDYAVTGLYFYNKDVVEYSKKVKPSSRGELEISDLNKIYLEKGLLDVEVLGRGFSWLDSGTHESLLESSEYVKTIQNNQGIQIACLEEIAYNLGWIDKDSLITAGKRMSKNNYGRYILSLIEV